MIVSTNTACVALAGVLVALPATAATARTYTLRDAVTEAVTASDAVAAADAKTDAERAKVDQTLMMFFPSATLSGGWAHLDSVPYVETEFDVSGMLPPDLLDLMETLGYDIEFEPQTMQLEMGRQDNFQFQLQAEQILFAGTGLHRQRQMAVAQLRSSQEEARAVRHDAAYQAEKMFWQVALAREAVAVTSEAIETAETHVGLLESFVEVGFASQADLMSAKVQLASLRLSALQARQSAELAENAFRMIVHVPQGEAVELDLDGGSMPVALSTDSVQITEVARAQRPEMRMLDQQYTSARHGSHAALSQWLPALALRGNAYLKNPDRALEPNWYWSADITVGLQWKLWDRGMALSQHRQAKAGMRQIEAYRRQLRDGIKLEIDQATSACRDAEEQMFVAGEAVDLAKESLRLQEVSFREGVARNVDVLEAQTQLSKARLDALSAETNYRISEAGLRKAAGLDLE